MRAEEDLGAVDKRRLTNGVYMDCFVSARFWVYLGVCLLSNANVQTKHRFDIYDHVRRPPFPFLRDLGVVLCAQAQKVIYQRELSVGWQLQLET
jgi:hypothetical protein